MIPLTHTRSVIAFVELAERFSFYGTQSLFVRSDLFLLKPILLICSPSPDQLHPAEAPALLAHRRRREEWSIWSSRNGPANRNGSYYVQCLLVRSSLVEMTANELAYRPPDAGYTSFLSRELSLQTRDGVGIKRYAGPWLSLSLAISCSSSQLSLG